MTKKQYIFPLVEVTKITFGGTLLSSLVEYPTTPLGPKSAPALRGSNTEVF
ncbi:MAG: hypothetical protein IKO26_10760 [Paludibacteraceae bacterium]|nr:hypothetical protein [Paludibacteraceae bacterium]